MTTFMTKLQKRTTCSYAPYMRGRSTWKYYADKTF